MNEGRKRGFFDFLSRLFRRESNPDPVESYEEFQFTIYHMPVVFQAPVRGKERFLRERRFSTIWLPRRSAVTRKSALFPVRRQIFTCWMTTR
jgi:hypothetical protein